MCYLFTIVNKNKTDQKTKSKLMRKWKLFTLIMLAALSMLSKNGMAQGVPHYRNRALG